MRAPAGPTRSVGRAGPRIAAILLGAAVACLATQLPALAHPLDVDLPPNYESRVTALEGDHRGVSARVTGGDRLLVLEVPAGVTVEVAGYDPPEQYLRFDAAGDVHANVAGPTYHYDTADGPIDLRLRPDLRADAEPRWQRVSSGGHHAWRDARIRWMGPDPTPPRLDTDRAQHVRDWEIPILVDGEPVTIAGELRWVPTPSPALPLAAGLFVAAATVARRSTTLSAAAVALGAVVTATVGIAGTGAMRSGSGARAAALLAAVVALILAVRAASRSAAPRARAQSLALAAVGLGVVVAFNLDVITTAVLPGALPSAVARPLIGAAAGAVVAGAVTSVLALRRDPVHAEVALHSEPT